MHLITRTVASTFTAAMIAAAAAPAAGAATPASATGQLATTTTVTSGVPLRDPDKCGSAFYRLRHHFFCKRHRHYS